MRWMWIDRILELEPRQRLVAIKHVSLAEEHLHDHFQATDTAPANPIMPASLILEGMAQTSGILVGHAEAFKQKVVLAKIKSANLDQDARPGDSLIYTAVIESITPVGAATAGTVELVKPGQSDRQTIGKIDLLFSHLDQNLAGTQFPDHNFVFSESFKTLLRASGLDADF